MGHMLGAQAFSPQALLDTALETWKTDEGKKKILTVAAVTITLIALTALTGGLAGVGVGGAIGATFLTKGLLIGLSCSFGFSTLFSLFSAAKHGMFTKEGNTSSYLIEVAQVAIYSSIGSLFTANILPAFAFGKVAISAISLTMPFIYTYLFASIFHVATLPPTHIKPA